MTGDVKKEKQNVR